MKDSKILKLLVTAEKMAHLVGEGVIFILKCFNRDDSGAIPNFLNRTVAAITR